MKRILSLLLCGILLMSCTSALALEFNAQTETPICKEPILLTVAVPDSAKIENYETNKQTLMLEERMGADLQFQVYPSSDYATKINLMVMSGDKLPDILIGGSFSDAMVYAWAQEGALTPLTEYYRNPEIAYYLNEAIDRCGTNFFSQLTMPDGEIFSVPQLNQSYGNEYPDKFLIYKPWLDALGMEIPNTTDELYAVLKAVAATDLNGNGIADEVGITGEGLQQWFSYLMNAFVYADDTSSYLVVNDGTLGYAYITDAWKEGLKYIRKLIAEGCIPVETITQDNTQWRSMINSDPQTVFGLVWTSVSQITTGGEERANNYIDVPPMLGPEGVQYATFNESTCAPRFLVSADCGYPEAAFRLGDLMVSTYFSIMTRWGEEGVNWDWLENAEGWENFPPAVEGAEPFFAEYKDLKFWSSTQQNSAWMQNGPFIRQYGIANGWVRITQEDAAEQAERLSENANAHYQNGGWKPAETFAKLLYTSEESAKAADIMATLTSYVSEKTANFLSGNLDINGYWDTYLSELKAIGIDAALEVNQEVFDRMYK